MDSYPSIFGTGAPRFVHDYGGAGETNVDLDYVIILRDEPDPGDIEHKSIKTGHREWTDIGKHWTFEVLVQLFRYANPYTAYQNFKQYKNELVALYKRRDGTLIKNSEDDVILFFIEAMEESYYDHYLYPDVLKIRFVSQDPIDIPITSGGGAQYSNEVLTYINRFSILPDEGTLAALATFIDGLVSDGIYQKIDEMWMFAMNIEANALLGIKNVIDAQVVNSPTFTAYRGFQTASTGAKYINLKFIPTTHGVNFNSTSSAMGCYNRTDVNENSYDMGLFNSFFDTNKTYMMRIRSTTGSAQLRLGTFTSSNQSISQSQGLIICGRPNTTQRFLSLNGASRAIAASTYNDFPNEEMYLGRTNGDASPVYSNKEYAFAFLGGTLDDTECASLFSRLETFLDYVGAGVIT